MISLGGLVILCAAMASGTIMIKKDFLKTMMQCGTVSRFRTTLIETPSEMPIRCVYSFARQSPEITQLRIEMEELELMQPKEVVGQSDQKTCVNRLVVNGMSICGKNNGQHLYVPMGSTHVNLVFEIPVNEPPTKWKLNVTQLASGGFPNTKSNQIHSLTNGLRKSLQKTFFSTDIENDAQALAPEGCTQYFTARTGIVESFNYNGGEGPYMSNMSYTICFKRYTGSHAVELHFEDFGLPNEGTQMGMDLDCHSAIPTVGRQEDYLAIPGASLVIGEATVHPTYFCGTTTSGKTVTFGSLGPYVVYFRSDLLSSPNDKGFRMNYRIL